MYVFNNDVILQALYRAVALAKENSTGEINCRDVMQYIGEMSPHEEENEIYHIFMTGGVDMYLALALVPEMQEQHFIMRQFLRGEISKDLVTGLD